MVERQTSLIHPLPEKAEELRVIAETEEVAGSNPAPPPSIFARKGQEVSQ